MNSSRTTILKTIRLSSVVLSVIVDYIVVFRKAPTSDIASHADVLRLVTRSSPSWGGTRDKPKNVCVGGYGFVGSQLCFYGQSFVPLSYPSIIDFPGVSL